MNVTCANCPAKYAVPDEKVQGKRARIKCKHCGADILIDGTSLVGSAPMPTAPPAPARSVRPTADVAPAQVARGTPFAKIATRAVVAPRAGLGTASAAQEASGPRAAEGVRQPAGAARGPAITAQESPAEKPQATPFSQPRPQPSLKHTIVGLAGPAPGSQAPVGAGGSPSGAAGAAREPVSVPPRVEPARQAGQRPAIGLAGARGIKQTLIGGLEAARFEAPQPPAARASLLPQVDSTLSQSEQLGGPWTVALADATQRQANLDELRELFSAGVINEDTLVWRDGMADWVALGSLTKLRESITKAGSVTPFLDAEPVTQSAPKPLEQSVGPEPVTTPVRPRDREVGWQEPGAWDGAQASPAREGTAGAAAGTAMQRPAPPLAQLSFDDEISMAVNTSVAEAEPLSLEGAGKSERGSPHPASGAQPLAGEHAPSGTVKSSAAPTASKSLAPAAPKGKSSARRGARPSARPRPGPVTSAIPSPPQRSGSGGHAWAVLLLLVLIILGASAIFITKQPQAVYEALAGALPEPARQALGITSPGIHEPAPIVSAAPAASEAAAPEDAPAPAIVSTEDTAEAAPPNPPAPTIASTPGPGATEAAPASPLGALRTPRDKRDKPTELGPFDEAAARAAAAQLAANIQRCRGDEAPGTGQVRITFAPNGEATGASVAGQYAASEAGLCLIDIFRQAKVPAFSGPAASISYDFTLR